MCKISLDLIERFLLFVYLTEHQDVQSRHTSCVWSRYKDKFSKATKNWSTAPLKAPKTYSYIDTLITNVITEREATGRRLDAPARVEPQDPKRIRPNIAKEPRPTKQTLIERHKTRFSK